MSNVAALVMAGGKNSPEMQVAAGGIENRALVPLGDRRMIDYVLDAVRGGMEGGRILVAGDVPLLTHCVPVPGGDSLVDTLMNGVAALVPGETRLLVVTADIPFLTAESVADFLRQAGEEDADFQYPIIPADLCTARFPAMRRTVLRIAEGTFTGGNLALLNPAFLREHDATLRTAYARRKDIPGLAKMLGPSLLARLLGSRLFPGLLTVRILENAVSRLLDGATVRAIVSTFPEIGADVDRPEDIVIARDLLQKKL